MLTAASSILDRFVTGLAHANGAAVAATLSTRGHAQVLAAVVGQLAGRVSTYTERNIGKEPIDYPANLNRRVVVDRKEEGNF